MNKKFNVDNLNIKRKDPLIDWSQQTTTLPTNIDVIKDYQALIDKYDISDSSLVSDIYHNPMKQTWQDHFNRIYKNLHITKNQEMSINVSMDDDSIEVISREELVKYLSERKLIQENEFVRKTYDRYQVAVKLARSDDNGTGN